MRWKHRGKRGGSIKIVIKLTCVLVVYELKILLAMGDVRNGTPAAAVGLMLSNDLTY